MDMSHATEPDNCLDQTARKGKQFGQYIMSFPQRRTLTVESFASHPLSTIPCPIDNMST